MSIGGVVVYWIVFAGFVVMVAAAFINIHRPEQPPPVETPLYLSDIMKHMTEAEASALMRAIRETRG